MGITIKCYVGAPGNRGASLFPEGRTYSPPAKQAAVSLPLVGLVRSPRGIASPAGAAGRCHSPVGSAVIVHAVIASTPAFASVSRGTVCTPALRQLPAKTCHRQLCRRYGYRCSGDTHFLFAKKKQKNKGERTVRTNGDLPLGSQGGQQRYGTLCGCRFRLSELYQYS